MVPQKRIRRISKIIFPTKMSLRFKKVMPVQMMKKLITRQFCRGGVIMEWSYQHRYFTKTLK